MPGNTAKEVLKLEAKAIQALVNRIDGRFNRAINLIYRSRGRAIIIGMGKPSFIAQKISASLASTGTPSISLHPADAIHGDIGRLTRKDVAVVLSKSGETEEIIRLLPFIKRIGCKLVSITGNVKSQLAKQSDVVLDVTVEKEAGPLNVAPTTSTTCMLAVGDAITMALVKKRKFGKRDFARLHPGGTLGKNLHLQVQAVMRKGSDNPCVRLNEKMKDVLLKITKARAGSATVVDSGKRCVGIFTDGDLRRQLKKVTENMRAPVEGFMTKKPLVIREECLAVEALEIFKKRRIDEMPVVDKKGRVVGLLDVQDLLKEGFILE